MQVLLTFAGARDPYNPELAAGTLSDGPVLSLLAERSFERIFVFADERFNENARHLVRAVTDRHRRAAAEVVTVPITDPTDYEEIFLAVNRASQKILRRLPPDRHRYFIATSSGTPQMQTVWFLLSQSHAIPAILFNVKPRRFLAPGQPAVSEITLSLSTFPQVRRTDLAAVEVASLRAQNEKLHAEREAFFRHVDQDGIIGKSKVIQGALLRATRAAATEHPVLLLGETGTGKELFAQLIHRRSARADGPFIPVNCAALPAALIESELFGYEKGAFTGADTARRGQFQLADGGTIFLDEVGDLPLDAQAKLLRVLNNGEIQRVGGTSRRVSVRVIAATNRDLASRVAERAFRQDLLYRLKVLPVEIPPLRERREDIPLLLERFAQDQSRPAGPLRFSQDTLRRLLEYSWPGNVRELRNVVAETCSLTGHQIIDVEDLPRELRHPANAAVAAAGILEIPQEGFDIEERLSRLRAGYLRAALANCKGNAAAAARLLNLKPHTYRKQMARIRLRRQPSS